jgi:hypothetical protein
VDPNLKKCVSFGQIRIRIIKESSDSDTGTDSDSDTVVKKKMLLKNCRSTTSRGKNVFFSVGKPFPLTYSMYNGFRTYSTYMKGMRGTITKKFGSKF